MGLSVRDMIEIAGDAETRVGTCQTYVKSSIVNNDIVLNSQSDKAGSTGIIG